MEVGKERSDVANCQACGSVDDGLQTVRVAAGQAGESDVAVVQIPLHGPDQTLFYFAL